MVALVGPFARGYVVSFAYILYVRVQRCKVWPKGVLHAANTPAELPVDSHTHGQSIQGSLTMIPTWLYLALSITRITAPPMPTPHMRTMSPVFSKGSISSRLL